MHCFHSHPIVVMYKKKAQYINTSNRYGSNWSACNGFEWLLEATASLPNPFQSKKMCRTRMHANTHTQTHTHSLTHTHTHTHTHRLLNFLCRTGVRVLHVGTFTGAFCILARKLSTPGACPMRMFSSFTPCAHARFKLTPCPYDCLIEIFHVFYQCTCACCILCTKPSTCCAWAIRICSSCTPCDFIQSSAALA